MSEKTTSGKAEPKPVIAKNEISKTIYGFERRFNRN
jgi:hypothetical protein